ncbi:MAG: anti-sigma factor antagonist [Clostridia bacterium]|nr:anti-sigma factor antagonist [Clostridia bacterium]
MCAARDRKPGFDSEFTGTVLKIKLRGEIDHHSAVAVRTAIDDMIRSKRPAQLIIDMSAVDFMDSSGLGLIMGRYAVMKDIGGTVKVSDPSPNTEKIMNLAGMERIIQIVHTSGRRAEALGETNRESAAVMTVGQTAAGKHEGKRRVKRNEKA